MTYIRNGVGSWGRGALRESNKEWQHWRAAPFRAQAPSKVHSKKGLPGLSTFSFPPTLVLYSFLRSFGVVHEKHPYYIGKCTYIRTSGFDKTFPTRYLRLEIKVLKLTTIVFVERRNATCQTSAFGQRFDCWFSKVTKWFFQEMSQTIVSLFVSFIRICFGRLTCKTDFPRKVQSSAAGATACLNYLL